MDLLLVSNIVNIVDGAAGTLQQISAAEAFRRYSWLKDAPVVNAAGDYRGMVISAEWRTVYVYSSSIEDKAGNVAILLSIAEELVSSRQQISSIINSSDDRYTKAAKLSAQVSGIASRVLAKLATGTISGVNWALRVTRWANIVFWLNQQQFMTTLSAMDRLTATLNADVDSYLSGGSVYYFATIVARNM